MAHIQPPAKSCHPLITLVFLKWQLKNTSKITTHYPYFCPSHTGADLTTSNPFPAIEFGSISFSLGNRIFTRKHEVLILVVAFNDQRHKNNMTKASHEWSKYLLQFLNLRLLAIIVSYVTALWSLIL